MIARDRQGPTRGAQFLDAPTVDDRCDTQTAEAYDAVFDTNLRGVFLSPKHELRVMTAQGFGSIVNLSSTFGERGGPAAALYSAGKHAVNGGKTAA